MQRVSTNLTLFYKFFIPIFWIVLVGSVTAAVFLSPRAAYGSIPGFQFRIGMLIFFLSGVAMLALTFMRIKRVEMDDYFIYVTNYFKNYRYPWHNVKSLHETRFFLLNVVTITLKEPGSFGKKMTFIASNRLYRSFWEERAELLEELKIEN